MADENAQQDGTIPVEEWIPHPPSDYVDWMDKDNAVAFDDLSGPEREAFLASLSDEDRAKFDATAGDAADGGDGTQGT